MKSLITLLMSIWQDSAVRFGWHWKKMVLWPWEIMDEESLLECMKKAFLRSVWYCPPCTLAVNLITNHTKPAVVCTVSVLLSWMRYQNVLLLILNVMAACSMTLTKKGIRQQNWLTACSRWLRNQKDTELQSISCRMMRFLIQWSLEQKR